MHLSPKEKRIRSGRWRCEMGAVVEKNELRHAPRRFQTFDRNGKVGESWFVFRIHELKIGKLFSKGAVKQLLSLHSREVFTVDPDEVDRPVLILPSSLLRQHSINRFGRVGQLYMTD